MLRFLIPFLRTNAKCSFQRDRHSSRAGSARSSGHAEFEGDVISYEISGNREGYGLRALADFTQSPKQAVSLQFRQKIEISVDRAAQLEH